MSSLCAGCCWSGASACPCSFGLCALAVQRGSELTTVPLSGTCESWAALPISPQIAFVRPVCITKPKASNCTRKRILISQEVLFSVLAVRGTAAHSATSKAWGGCAPLCCVQVKAFSKFISVAKRLTPSSFRKSAVWIGDETECN